MNDSYIVKYFQILLAKFSSRRVKRPPHNPDAIQFQKENSIYAKATKPLLPDSQLLFCLLLCIATGGLGTIDDSIGKQSQTIDKLSRTNFYFYDARGLLTNTTYADGLF